MNRIFFLLPVILFFLSDSASACVGKVLNLGIIDDKEQAVVSELLSLIVTERTGTTVKVTRFRDAKSLYDSVRKGDISMIVLSPNEAARQTNLPLSQIDAVKAEYRKKYDMIWLESWNVTHRYTPLISTSLLSSLPALPRLVNKLPAAVNNDSFQKLIKSSGSGGQDRKLFRDYLKSRKLI